MSSDMFYLCILVFCQVSICTISKRLQILLYILLQIFIFCLNPGIGYCFSNQLHCILVEDSSHVLHVPIVCQTKSFLL
jgi:hypothetical protein